MTTSEDLTSWLQAANRRYSEEATPHDKRPFLAICEFTRERNCSIPLSHPIAKFILHWFYDHSPPNAHQVGPIYTGVYFYDAAFWPVSVPIIFGQVRIDAFECLGTMPEGIKAVLRVSQTHLNEYINHWANCLDHGYGNLDISSNHALKERAASFLSSANAEIRGANAQLLDKRPNHKAVLSFRMANEIFLKTVLVQELDLTDQDLKKVSHKLEDAAKRCADATGESLFEEIAERANVYPPISARYDQPHWSAHEVWEAAFLAQFSAAAVTRLYGDHDMRSQIFPQS